MKGKNLILAGIGGSIAWFSYKFLLNMGVTENLCFYSYSLFLRYIVSYVQEFI